MNMPEETETTQQKQNEDSLDFGRTVFLRNLNNKNLLNDEMISQEEGEIFFSKPFSQWPKAMQEKLGPHGAAMIE